MKAPFTSHQQLREYYQAEMAGMRQSFERTGNGVLCIRRRALIVDCLLEPLWRFESGGPIPPGLALMGVGGFGRKELFPCSDVDLLYLCADEKLEDRLREHIRGCNQAMWDLGLRASPMIRTPKECDRYDPDNIEFTLSMLDRRFIAGDHALAQTLQTTTLPEVALREWNGIVHRLADLARARHQKYGNTIFHLEPNIKECPGGLRDHQLAHWLNLLHHVREHKAWPTSFGNSLYSVHNDAASAFEFLSATRCFLHLRSGRDDNSLDWHAQDEAAAQSIGLETKGTSDPAYWMRTYYRHARTV